VYMSWIKSRLLPIISIIAGIATLVARYAFIKANRLEAKVAQGEAKAVAEFQKAKIEQLANEVKHVEANRKALVDQWRRFDSDSGER
jgi:hypothetical protein